MQHFKFESGRRITFPFKEDNKADSEVKVGRYMWNIYRFRNATVGEWITACVGREISAYSHCSVLHIVKGKVNPEVLLAAE